MSAEQFLNEFSRQLAYLFHFSRQMNELDFAGALSGEFRGAQDAGWATTITAQEVREELATLLGSEKPLEKHEIRIALMLYCQLSEAGGVYETLKNLMGTIRCQPYLLWPFKDLVKVRKKPTKVIGPNANATFRDLSSNAKDIGMSRLSELLETAFHDDIRNGISHADYVIWHDGLRIRNRNGGNARLVSFGEVSTILSKGIGFFELLFDYVSQSVHSFAPAKTIVGRFSANFAMPWTVEYNPESGSFSISGSSPGPQTTPDYVRQEEINTHLGGRIIAVYYKIESEKVASTRERILNLGFEPHEFELSNDKMNELIESVNDKNLWNLNMTGGEDEELLLLSPLGFCWLKAPEEIEAAIGVPKLSLVFSNSNSN